MIPYSYLVLGVDPTSNEANIPVSKSITVSFAKPINVQTLNNNTIRLKKVNGDYVEYIGKYDYQLKQYTITPKLPLEHSVQYQTIVMGGKEGVLSVDEGYLPATMTYEFTTTTEDKSLPVLGSLTLQQEYLFVSAKWTLPSSLALEKNIRFYIKLSLSKNPEAAPIWPKDPVEGYTTSTSFIIPYKTDVSKQYYVHVQGDTNSGKTNWISSQIYIESIQEEKPVVPKPPVIDDEDDVPNEGDQNNEGDPPVLRQLEIVDYGPKIGEIVTPHEFIVIFNEELLGKEEDDMSNLLYIVNAPYKENLSLFDLRGKYSPQSSVGGKVSIDEESPNMLVLSLDEKNLKSDTEYTAVLSKDVKSASGDKFGYTQTFGFTTEPEHFYGDLEHIKASLNSYEVYPSDQFIQRLMKKYSQYVYDIWSSQTTFTEDNVPYYIHEYVNTQAMMDGFISSGVSSKVSGGGGDESFSLGDLTITKSGGGGEDGNGLAMSSILSQLKDQLKYWEDLIHGHHNRGYAKPSSTVKGENSSTYPEYLTRSTLVQFDG